MKPICSAAVVFLMFSTLAFGHGEPVRIMGIVTRISTDSIVVSTTGHKTRTVNVTASTRFVKSGEPSSLKELTVGDRVVIAADDHGKTLDAVEVRFGKPKVSQQPPRESFSSELPYSALSQSRILKRGVYGQERL